MTLNAYVAQKKREIFDDLFAGLAPREGVYSETLWKDGKAKGQPQMGSTRYLPDKIVLEFIYNDPHGVAVVLPVELDPPQRIVFLPVPSWVIESIWQGDIDGTYHFESDAFALAEQFRELLNPEPNAKLFGPKQATRRE